MNKPSAASTVRLVRSFLPILGLVLASNLGMADGTCSKATEFEPALCPLKLARVVSVRIERNAAKAEAAQAQDMDCAAFTISPRAVKRYFAKAKAVNESDAHPTLDWSGCYASGTLTLENGKQAKWSLDQYRTGTLTMDGAASSLSLYCPNCQFKPFQ